MKKILLLLLLLSCKPKPEFYIDGKPYYTKEVCLKSKSEHIYEYHYGYSLRGRFEYHYGGHWVTTCIESKIDTLEIK